MIKHYKYKDHDEWISLRKKYIGGSDAGAIIGMNPYKSAYSLWAEKTGKTPEFEGNITTKVGAYLEDFVAKMFEDEKEKKVKRHNSMMVNDKYPWAEANVDRLIVGENALLEIKTSNSVPVMKKVHGGEFPDSWYAQMTHYLAVTELEKAYLAVLVNCREFYVFELNRDQAEIDALMKAEKDFWNLVETGREPSIDGSNSSTDTVTTLYPESDGTEVNLFAYETDLQQYVALNEQIKSLKALKEEMANRVKVFMKESAKGNSDKFRVSWTSSERKTFDTKRFQADHSDMDLSEYFNSTTTRTFKVTERKN